MPTPSSEVFSHRVVTRRRMYFFDVKRLDDGSRYLSVSEVKERGGREASRARIIVAEEELGEFHEGLARVLRFLGFPGLTQTKSVEQIRQQYPKAYAKWTPEDDQWLRQAFAQGQATRDLAKELQRQPGAIRSRLARLGLI